VGHLLPCLIAQGRQLMARDEHITHHTAQLQSFLPLSVLLRALAPCMLRFEASIKPFLEPYLSASQPRINQATQRYSPWPT